MYTEFERQISETIKQLRQNANYTQETLAAKLQLCGCDITRSAVAKLESLQRHIRPDEIRALKEVFNVTYDDILK